MKKSDILINVTIRRFKIIFIRVIQSPLMNYKHNDSRPTFDIFFLLNMEKKQ